MKRAACALLLACFCLQLPGCVISSKEEKEGFRFGVWYRYRTLSSAADSPVAEIEYYAANRPDMLHEALKLLTEEPESDELVSAFPPSLRISSYNLSDGVLDVYLTSGYGDMDAVDRGLARCCLVLTLCALDEVDSVNIYQEDSLLEEGLTADMMLIKNSDAGEYEKELTLYFPDDEGRALSAENRRLTISADKPLAEYIIEELLRGTQRSQGEAGGEAEKRFMPEGTKLLSVGTEDGLCVVDFSDEFYKNRPLTASAERLLLYSIVNSLTLLDDIESVQIRVEGETLPSYSYIDISRPLTRAEEFIRTGGDYWTSGFLNVYLGTADGRMTAVSVAAGPLNYEQWASSVAGYYISLDRFWGYRRLVPEGTRLLSAETTEGVCRLNLSAEFLNGSDSGRYAAARAIAATLYDAGAAQSVRFFVSDEPLYGGREIRKDERVIVK